MNAVVHVMCERRSFSMWTNTFIYYMYTTKMSLYCVNKQVVYCATKMLVCCATKSFFCCVFWIFDSRVREKSLEHQTAFCIFIDQDLRSWQLWTCCVNVGYVLCSHGIKSVWTNKTFSCTCKQIKVHVHSLWTNKIFSNVNTFPVWTNKILCGFTFTSTVNSPAQPSHILTFAGLLGQRGGKHFQNLGKWVWFQNLSQEFTVDDQDNPLCQELKM